MSIRKIPEIVYDAGYAAHVHGGTPTAIIEAAMPLAFAAELRDLLRTMEEMRLEMRAEDSIPLRSSGLSEGIGLLRRRIAELDPEGLTK